MPRRSHPERRRTERQRRGSGAKGSQRIKVEAPLQGKRARKRAPVERQRTDWVDSILLDEQAARTWPDRGGGVPG
ncbi:MAG: hypothetical protein ACLP62_11260, partial [Acidimicrobiales bacterium]